MTDTPLTPALTPEEWRTLRQTPHTPTSDERDFDAWDVGVVRRDGSVFFEYVDEGCRREIELDPHPTAALCLYGQPFGFTHEEAEFLALVSGQWRSLRLGPHQQGVFDGIVAKIAALLPPSP